VTGQLTGAEFDGVSLGYESLVARSTGFGGVEHDFFTRRKVSALLDLTERTFGRPDTLRALDVGCGVGLTDAHLRGRFAELHGIDPSRVAVGRAMTANPEVRYKVLDGDVLPYPDASFDLVFAICVVHHVPPSEWLHFVTEMRRVVRPGGLVVVFEHNPLNPLTRLSVLRCEFDDAAVLLSMTRARRLLVAAGLEPAEQRFIVFVPSERRVARALEDKLARVALGAQYYVAARRPIPLTVLPGAR
jgi:SAM-dependent methyltransferase